MEDADSTEKGCSYEELIYIPKGWEIKPPLWGDGKERFFERKGITFVTNGEVIKAQTKNTSLSAEEFLKAASEIIERFIDAYILVKGQFFEVVGLTERYYELKCAPPTVVKKKVGEAGPIISPTTFCAVDTGFQVKVIKADEEKDFDLSRQIFELCEEEKGLTLRGSLSYYRLALTGIDQLATAGNLYMAMEELLAKFNVGKKRRKWRWEKLTDNLAKYDPGLTEDKLLTLKQLHRARHAFDDNGNKNDPLSSEELDVYKRLVKEYLLAYVRWLRENRRGRPHRTPFGC